MVPGPTCIAAPCSCISREAGIRRNNLSCVDISSPRNAGFEVLYRLQLLPGSPTECSSSTTMARQRNQKKEKLGFKLSQPDRSTPDPSRETLLKLAQDRGLLQDDNADDGEEVVVGRVAESLLWSVSLTMLHFTVDFLVHHQYAMSLSWSHIAKRSLQAYPGSYSSPPFSVCYF